MNENFDSLTDEQSDKITFRKAYWVYDLLVVVTRCLTGPQKTHKTAGQGFRDQAESLAESIGMAETSDKKESVVKTSQALLEAHRTVEDTHARRRLEKWARKVIICYLGAVFALVILNGMSRIIWPTIFKESGFITDKVMYAILTTTTANILGLGFIVLRGHFPSNEHKKKKENSPH